VRVRTPDPQVSDEEARTVHHLCPTGALRLVSDDRDGAGDPSAAGQPGGADDPERTES
jgi:hypothetical protein